MSYGLAFGFPRNNTLAAAASPFTQLGPTLDLIFAGAASSGDPTAGLNDSLDLNFIGNQYSVGAPYMVWAGTGMTAENFQDIVTFSRASANATYTNSSGYLTTAGVWNYITYSNAPENAAWSKSASFIQTNLLTYSQEFDNAAWSKGVAVTIVANADMAPDGTLTAERFVSVGGAYPQMSQSVTLSAGNYTGSLWVRSDGTPQIEQSILLDGTPQAFTPTSTWTRITVTKAGVTAGSRAFVIATNNPTAPASSFYIWGAQLVQGSVPGNYQATTSAALAVLYSDYTGALRARKLCENTTTALHYIAPGYLSSSPLTPNQVYSYTVEVKAGERSRLYMDGRRKDNTFFNLSVDLTTGVITPGTNLLTYNSVNLGNGWWQINFTTNVQSGAFSESWAIAPDTGAGGAGYAGNGSDGIYVTNMRVAPADIGTAYFDTTVYPYNAPRFDYDPITLLPKGLLIEEQRTNLLLQSENWTVSWSFSNTTFGASVLAPNGTITANRLEATTTAVTTITQSVTATATSHTASIYAKQGSAATDANRFMVFNATTATVLLQISIDYSTGIITHLIGAGATSVNVGNGFWRIQLPVTTGITVGNTLQFRTVFDGGSETAGEYAYVWGAQLEAGAFATSYIPTTTSQLTRAADLASVDTLSPWFNATLGSLYVEFDSPGYDVTTFPAAAQIGIKLGGSRGYLHVLNGSVATTSFNIFDDTPTYQGVNTPVAYVTGAVRKQIGAYAVNNSASSIDGSTPVTDTSVTLPTGLNCLAIGTYSILGATRGGTMRIRRISYYPRRLSNTELQTLTTL